MRRYRVALLAMGLVAFALIFSSCGGGGGDDGGWYACSYEKRITGCNNWEWKAWEAYCFSFNSDDYYITPQEVCDNMTSTDPYCQGDCCINVDVRDENLSSGDCP